MTSDALLEELLSKPVGPAIPGRTNQPKDFTSKLEIKGDTLEATLQDVEGVIDQGKANEFLIEEGQDPNDWEATHFRKIKYGVGMESVKFSYKRRVSITANDRPNLDELFDAIEKYIEPDVETMVVKRHGTEGTHTFIVVLGDMQFGKIDGDGVEGTLQRTIDCLNKAADLLAQYRLRFDISHVHIAWMGDHIEGFESQGGANVWRTPLTLNEQIRLTRRVMLHALLTFAPLCERLTMAAVPGNHGEAARFNGKGVTRYDDSHDTESLIAVKDAAELNTERFGHVEFYVPDTDEMTVVLDCSGTVVAHAHGHQWRPSKHFDWWKGQAFNKQSAMHQADLLLAGHLHHEHTDSDGPRTFVQPPAMESESTWWRHSKGTTGAPGLIVAITSNGQTNVKEIVR